MSLKIKNLTKRFGEKTVIDNFTYDFSDTGLFLIYGRSGVGKTTLLRIISGLESNYLGEIIGAGKENVSYLFQEYRLFPTLSALDNVLLTAYDNPSEDNKNEAMSILLELGITKEEAQLLPSELSGGMKQRVAFARAILAKRPILLLDEPMKELNEELYDSVRKLIVKEAEKRLVIMVSHNSLDREIENINLIEMKDAEA